MGVLARLAAGITAVALGVAGCASNAEKDAKTLTVSVSPGPYSIVFKDGVEPLLKSQGYTLT